MACPILSIQDKLLSNPWPNAAPLDAEHNSAVGELTADILDAFPFYFLLVDAEHRIAFANRAVRLSLDLAPEELLGSYCPKSIHGLDAPFPGCPLEEAAGRNVSVERELFDEKSGCWMNSAVYPTASRTPAGIPLYAHIVRDITAEKLTENALRERAATEEMLSSVTSSLLATEFTTAELDSALTRISLFLGCQRYAVYLDTGADRLELIQSKQVELGAVLPPLAPELSREFMPRWPFVGETESDDESWLLEIDGSGNRESTDDAVFAVVPISVGGAATGFARFDHSAEDTNTRVKNAHLRKLLANALSIAFERRVADRKVSAHAERLRSMALQLSAAEERERRRIASDLHDQIGQTLALSIMKVSNLESRSESRDLAKELGTVRSLIEKALTDAKSLMFELSPPVLHQFGLGAALEWLLEQFGQRSEISWTFECEPELLSLDDDQRMFLFRAVQELLSNVHRHAGAKQVDVSLAQTPDGVRVEIADDGAGMDVTLLESPQNGVPLGFGLFSIRERLQHIGGSLEVESSTGHGTRITLTLPEGAGKPRSERHGVGNSDR